MNSFTRPKECPSYIPLGRQNTRETPARFVPKTCPTFIYSALDVVHLILTAAGLEDGPT